MRRTEGGFALLQVLLVFAMLAVIVSQLQYAQRIQIERAYQSLFLGQAQAYIDSAEAIAQVGLKLDLDNTSKDTFGEAWNQPIGPLPLDEGSIALDLNDLQGRFNINWLHPDSGNAPAAMESMKRLLLELGLGADIAEELKKWFDKDSGAEFDYLDMEPSYTPSFQLMADITELRLLKSVDREAFAVLAPYVSALPADAPLNINTASQPVMMALVSYIGQAEAQQLIDARPEEGYDSVDALTNQALFQQNDAPLLLKNLSVVSYWFDLYSEVTLDDRTLIQRSRLYRDKDTGVVITQRSQSATEPNSAPEDPSLPSTSGSSGSASLPGMPAKDDE